MGQQETAPNEQLVLDSARTYHDRAVPVLFEPWGRRLLEEVPLGPGDDVLDVACGSGAVSRLAAARVGEAGAVTGLDLNPGMIQTAEEACKHVRPRIEFRTGDATELPFEDGHFDVALCQQGIQFMPDRPAAIREMHRVLRPGGWAGFTQWLPVDHVPGYRVLCDALDRHIDAEAGAVMRTPFGGESGAVLRQMTEEAGFRQVRHTIQIGSIRFPSAKEFTQMNIDAVPPGPKGHLKAMYASVDPERRTALFEAVEQGLAPFRDDQGLLLPMTTHLVVAWK